MQWIWLVVSTNPPEKYDFVNWDDLMTLEFPSEGMSQTWMRETSFHDMSMSKKKGNTGEKPACKHEITEINQKKKYSLDMF